MGDKLVTAAEATPEDQYKWLMLLVILIVGVDEEGNLLEDTGTRCHTPSNTIPKS